jgi:hypothetical protein
VRCFTRGLSQATTEILVKELWLDLSRYKNGGVQPWGPKGFAQILRLVRVLGLRADKEESMLPNTVETAVQTILQADLDHLEGLFFQSTIRIRPSDTRVIASLIERAQKLRNLVLPSLNTAIEGEPMAAVSKVGLWLQYTGPSLNLWFRPGADLQIASVFAQKGGTIHSLCLFGHDLESSHAISALRRLGLSEQKMAEPRRLLICDLAMPNRIFACVSFAALNTLTIVDCDDCLYLLQNMTETPTLENMDCMRNFTWMERRRSVWLGKEEMGFLIKLMRGMPKLRMARIHVKSRTVRLLRVRDLVAALPSSLVILTLYLGNYEFSGPVLEVLGVQCPQLMGLGLRQSYKDSAPMHISLEDFKSRVSLIAVSFDKI